MPRQSCPHTGATFAKPVPVRSRVSEAQFSGDLFPGFDIAAVYLEPSTTVVALIFRDFPARQQYNPPKALGSNQI
jgi:hypothetical protein